MVALRRRLAAAVPIAGLAFVLPGSAQEKVPDPAPCTMHWGRLVDVYGQRANADGRRVPWRCAADVLIAPVAPPVAGARIVRLPCDPDTLQARVLIEAEIGSPEFARAMQALQASAPELGAEVPRDAVLRVRWRDGQVGARVPSLHLEAVETPLATRRVEHEGEVLLIASSGAPGQIRLADLPSGRVVLRPDDANPARSHVFTVAGRLPDPEPLYLIGELACRLERALVRDDGTAVLSLLLDRRYPRVDAGGVVRIDLPRTGRVSLEVLAESRTADGSDRLHVLVRAPHERAAEELAVAGVRRQDGPRDPAQYDAFVRARTPAATLVVRGDADAAEVPAAFVRIDAGGDGARGPVDAQAIGSQVGFTLRFSQPVSPQTLGVFDAVTLTSGGPENVMPLRVFDADGAGTAWRFAPPLGVLCTKEMRDQARADLALPPEQRRVHFHVRVLAGAAGPKSIDGGTLATPIDLPLTIDPDAADNLVAFRVFGR